MNKLITLMKNPQGGAVIKTTVSESELDVFKKQGQGLYAWVTESQYKLMVDSTKRYPIKFGQYGTNAVHGSTPQNTIDSYAWINEPIIILWAYRFTKSDIERKGSAFFIEQVINKTIGRSIKDGRGTETFMTTLTIIKEKFSDVMFGNKGLNTFGPRDPQQEFINKYVEHRKNDGSEFLLGAIMRFGKNFAWLCGVREVISYNGNVLVLTSKPGVFDSLKDDVTNHIYFNDWEYVDLREVNVKEDFELDNTRNSIVVVSTQLSYNKVSGAATRKFLSRNSFNDIFLDECHSGTDTIKFKNLLEVVNTEHKTFASGTPYKTIVSRGFNDTNTYFYGYIEQQISKNKDKDLGIPNSAVTLECYIPAVYDGYKNNDIYTAEEQFRITKLLAVNEDGNFIFGGDARDFLLDVLGKSNNKKRYSPFRSVAANLDHTVWLLPNSVDVAKAVGRLLEEIAPEYKVIVASGNETKDIQDVHDAIDEFDKTITLPRYHRAV